MFGGWVRRSDHGVLLQSGWPAGWRRWLIGWRWGHQGPFSPALEVRGHLFCKSASFCTVAIQGERCHITPPSTPLVLSPSPPPSHLHHGKMGEASIKPFFLFVSILWSCSFKKKKEEKKSKFFRFGCKEALRAKPQSSYKEFKVSWE